MKTREELARFIETQLYETPEFAGAKHGKYHFGLIELRAIMDFLYGGPPKKPEEELKSQEFLIRFCKDTWQK